MHLAKFRIIQISQISWFWAHAKRLDNFRANWSYTRNPNINKSFKKECNHRYLQEKVFCLILHLTLARILFFLSLEENCVTLKVLKIPHGNIVITKVLKRNAVRGIFKKTLNLRNFAFYNFSEDLGFRQLEDDCPTLQLLKIPHWIITKNKIYIFKNLPKKDCT